MKRIFFLLAIPAISTAGILPQHNQIAYSRLTSFDGSGDSSIGHTATSGDGSRIVYSTSPKRVYTVDSSGSGLSKIFDYAEDAPTTGAGTGPFVAINHDGTRVAWTNGFDHIYISDFDGSNRIEVASLFSVNGSDVEPRFEGNRFKFAGNGKLYFHLSLGVAASLQDENGIYSVNADGTGQQRVLSYEQIRNNVPGPSAPLNPLDFGASITQFDVSDDGARIVGGYDLPHHTGGISTQAGTVFTYEGGVINRIAPARSARSIQAAISADGEVIAYDYPSLETTWMNTFAGDSEDLIYGDRAAGLDLEMVGDGSHVVIAERGSGSSKNVALVARGRRLDIVPVRLFPGVSAMSLSRATGRMTWVSGWLSPHSVGPFGFRVVQLFSVDVNPANLAGFPQVSNLGMMPHRIDRVARDLTAGSAHIVGAGTDVFMSTHFNGVVQDNFRIAEINDLGEDLDLVGNDGRFTGLLEPYSAADSRSPELGRHTLRVTAANAAADRMLALDGFGPEVFDGPPPADQGDDDGDGVSNLLEEGFLLDPNNPDEVNLPVLTSINDGGVLYPGVTFLIKSDGFFDEENNLYRVADLFYLMEVSEDLHTWRTANSSEVVFLPVVENGDGSNSISARFTTSFEDLGERCFLRPVIRRGAPGKRVGASGGDISGSTILTFDSSGSFDRSYGNRVSAAMEGDFSYGGSGGFTPDVEVGYAALSLWPSGYGDLINSVYSGSGSLDVALNADAGHSVILHGFDLATFSSSDDVIDSISVISSDGSILWMQENVTIPTDGHVSIDFEDGLESAGMTVRVDASNLGATSDNIGMDNVSFSQRRSLLADDWSVLTFEVDGAPNFSVMDPGYGDRINGPVMGNFRYEGGGIHTPNVVLESYPNVRHTSSGYGDLENIVYGRTTETYGMTFVLRADPGFRVQLNGFQLSASSAVLPLTGIKVFDGNLDPLFAVSDLALPTEGRRHFDFSGAPFEARTIVLRIDTSKIPNRSAIGIDNLSFSQIPTL